MLNIDKIPKPKGQRASSQNCQKISIYNENLKKYRAKASLERWQKDWLTELRFYGPFNDINFSHVKPMSEKFVVSDINSNPVALLQSHQATHKLWRPQWGTTNGWGFMTTSIRKKEHETWAVTWQNQQNGCAASENSDQPWHPPSLIRVFAVRMKKAWALGYPLSAQWRLWSDWADAQADLSLCWAHTHFVGFIMSWLTCSLARFVM